MTRSWGFVILVVIYFRLNTTTMEKKISTVQLQVDFDQLWTFDDSKLVQPLSFRKENFFLTENRKLFISGHGMYDLTIQPKVLITLILIFFSVQNLWFLFNSVILFHISSPIFNIFYQEMCSKISRCLFDSFALYHEINQNKKTSERGKN